MNQTTPAFSSSSSSSTPPITTIAAQPVLLSPSHDDMLRMRTEDLFLLLFTHQMELEEEELALNSDLLASQLALIHAQENRIISRPCKRRKPKRKVGGAGASLPSPLPTNNLDVIEEAPSADAPSVKRCRRS